MYLSPWDPSRANHPRAQGGGATYLGQRPIRRGEHTEVMAGSGQAGRLRRTRFGTRWLLACALLVLAGGSALALWLEARRELEARHPQIEGQLAAPGLKAPLRILRDRGGVPHIRAETRRDAWFGLGFVHAQDRLGQMLIARRTAWGRSAEILGPSGLESDRWARTLGFGRLASLEAEALAPREQKVLEAYSAGVNAWLGKVRAGAVGRPVGVSEAEIEPEWRPVDSLAVLKQRAWTLGSTLEESLALDAVIRRVGPSLARAFFPAAARGSAAENEAWEPRAPTALRDKMPGWRDPLRELAGHRGRGIGSSALLVSGRLARRGAPLLAADAHYPALAPAEVHQSDLRGGSLSVAGVTIPGAPVFWTGFNPDVVWAVTHLPVVVTDLVIETVHAEREARVFDGNRWRDFEQREERIEVRGADPETLVVRSTPRGPMVHELLGSSVPMSVRWMGARKGRPLHAFLSMADAEDAEEARAALASHHEPVVAVLAADRKQGFYQLAGGVPDRDLPSGLVPLPRGDRGYGWDGALDQAELPYRKLGSSAPWLIAADGPLGRSTGQVEVLWRSGARAHQWAEGLRDLRAEGRFDEGDLVKLQDNSRSERARRFVERAVQVAQESPPRSREAREVLSLLEGWQGEMSSDRPEAAAYHVFVGRLLRHLFEPELGPELLERLLGLRGLEPSWLLSLSLDHPDSEGPEAPPWARRDRVAQGIQRSLRETWLELSVTLGPNRKKWGWGRLHPLRFVPRVGDSWRNNPQLGPFPFGGDDTTLRFGEYRPLDSFATAVVAIHRLVADASDLDQALVFLAPGQLEQAGHPWEADGVTQWRFGKPALLSTRDPVVADALVAELQLEPAH